ncbi:sensor histidine kinase [Asaia prunellae]|uniref:sensor histidine kinase n=1 Tax=Asaia prunellae TaxID=610245 RepID=UPI0034E24C7A
MSSKDIKEKWLFVAYSEKSIHIPNDYRDRIKTAGQFAGSKGIGRFACDTLGENLHLYSKTVNDNIVSKLEIDWSDFDKNATDEFQQISVALGQVSKFPDLIHASPPKDSGTVLIISDTHETWDIEKIKRLRRDLAKLIDPFGTTKSVTVSTWLVSDDVTIDGVNGPVGNEISDLLRDKTSRIEVVIENDLIETILFDRGRKIYAIREPSPYEELHNIHVQGSVFFLNNSAKKTFARRMGVTSVAFGSIFLFLNGFRIFPIGEEFDDTLGLNRRKQQGQRRYLGTRDLLGRIDVVAPPRKFREVSSRDAGLVDDANRRALFDAIRRQMVFRLERYVVGVNWADALDKNRDTADGLATDESRDRILRVIGNLARSRDIEIIYYDEDIVRVSDDPDRITDETLKSIVSAAESRGDANLLAQIEQARARIEELRSQRREAQMAANLAIAERARADARIESLERQAAFLGSSKRVDVERAQLLMHQAIIHAGHIRSAVGNAAHKLNEILELAVMPQMLEDLDDLEDILASVRQSARSASSSIANATLSGDRLSAVLSFAPNIRVDLKTDLINGDLLGFLSEYFQFRLDGVPGMPRAIFDASGISLKRDFSPVDISVLIDNLQDNARKAKANEITFKAIRKGTGKVVIKVTDDGRGINLDRVDPTKIFERGYTESANGTGLGLYSAKQILQLMDGSIELVGDGSRADFEITISGELS